MWSLTANKQSPLPHMNPNNNNDVVSYFIASYQQRDFEPKFMVVSNWYKYQGFLAFYIDYSHISSFCSTKKLFSYLPILSN